MTQDAIGLWSLRTVWEPALRKMSFSHFGLLPV